MGMSLRQRLTVAITDIIENGMVDPSMFPFIKDISRVKNDDSLQAIESKAIIERSTQVIKSEPSSKRKIYGLREFDAKTRDMWGRKYEDSRYQWLPAEFDLTY